jgi:rare lipoprotein A
MSRVARALFPGVILACALGLPGGAPAAESRTGPEAGKAAKARPAQPKAAQPKATRTGLATYYGKGLDGNLTASGEVFDKTQMVAAHPSYPAGTRARVTNLRNGRSQEVRIIDRGPTLEHQERGVIIDVSEGVATRLGFRQRGKTRVKVEVLEWGSSDEAAR